MYLNPKRLYHNPWSGPNKNYVILLFDDKEVSNYRFYLYSIDNLECNFYLFGFFIKL